MQPIARQRVAPSLILLLVLVFLQSGCVQTTTLPARQLDSGETVASGGINGPVPLELFGQVTTRVGKGDLSANLGLSSSSLLGGVAGRRYLGERINAQTQLRVGWNEQFASLLAVGGVQSVPSAEMPLYVGIHGGTRTWIAEPAPEGTAGSFFLPGKGLDPLVGGSVGIGRIDLGPNWRVQIELELTANLGTDAAGGDYNLLPAPNRLSIAVFRPL